MTIQRSVPRDRDRNCEHDRMGQITMDFQCLPLKRCKPAHVGRIPQDARHRIRPPPSPSTLEPLAGLLERHGNGYWAELSLNTRLGVPKRPLANYSSPPKTHLFAPQQRLAHEVING